MNDDSEPDQVIRRLPASPGGPDPVRASDAERENALRALAAHYADGRLDQAEFDVRADSALVAVMQSQLEALFADLPGPSPVPEASTPTDTPPAVRPPWRGPALIGPPFLLLVPIFVVFAVTTVIHGYPPFPLIPILFILSRRNQRWNREA